MPLTDSKLRAVRPNGTRYELPDRQGLALRVGSTGSMVWTLTYTVRGAALVPGDPAPPTRGERRRMNIGSYPEMSLSEAREHALKLRRGAKNGVDPRPSELEITPPVSSQVVTVADLIDRYVREHLHRNLASGGGVERLLRRHVEPRWGSRTIDELVATDLVDLLEIIRVPAGVVLAARGREQRFAAIRGGRGSAAEVRKWVRAMFQFAAAVGMLPANPFREVRNRDRLRPRDRVLSMDELAAIWRAAGRMYYPWGALFRLLLLTGNRRGEWAEARWDWLDAAATQLEIPASAYKTDRVHVVPFSVQVSALVRGLPRPEFGPYLLSSSGGFHIEEAVAVRGPSYFTSANTTYGYYLTMTHFRHTGATANTAFLDGHVALLSEVPVATPSSWASAAAVDALRRQHNLGFLSDNDVMYEGR